MLWGLPGDVPVPGDYNGDGTTDIAIFRPSVGGWYINENGAQPSSTDCRATSPLPNHLPTTDASTTLPGDIPTPQLPDS